MTDVAEAKVAREKVVLPWQLRGAWLAELLFVPVGIVSLAELPLNDGRVWAMVSAQVAVAVAVAVGLRRRSRIAWVVAIVLAAYVVYRTVSSAPGLTREVLGIGGREMVFPIVVLAWAFLTQLTVLLFCLALFWRGAWRTELR
jgi:hypothetical protein